jgi:hypothetical protein
MSYKFNPQDKVDLNNTTNVNLGNGGVFTGVATDITAYKSVAVSVQSDQASALDGLQIEQSADNIHWHWTDNYTINAGAAKVFTIPPHLQWFRIVYTNGATPTTDFELSVILKASAMTPSGHRIQDAITDEDDAQLVKSILTGKANGSFKNVRTTEDGDLSISNNSSGLAIAEGNVTGANPINKFGNAPSFATGDNEVDVWDGADDTSTDKMVYTYSTAADIDTISSSSGTDTQLMEIQGLDDNYDLVIQTKALNGQNKVTLDTPLRRVFRVKNVNGTPLTGDVYVYVDTTIASGVPTTIGPIRAKILIGNGQTEMAIFTVPAGTQGYIQSIYASTAGANKDTNYVIKLFIKPFGQTWQLKHRRSINDNKDLDKIFFFPEFAGEKADIRITAQITEAGITTGNVSAGFDVVLKDIA